MSTETGNEHAESDLDGESEGMSSYMRSVTVTTTATLAGIVAALLSMARAAGPEDTTALIWLFALILAQFPFYKVLGIEIEEFGAKDFLYVAFMTFALWFIAWGILLTAGM